MTLKRKKKALQVELQHQTLNYREAFQKEMDLRSRMEEKYDSLRLRYEVSGWVDKLKMAQERL